LIRIPGIQGGVLWRLLTLAAVSGACGDLDVGTVVPEAPDFRPEADPVRVVVTPPVDTIVGLGVTTAFSAVALGPEDQLLQSASITWRSADTNVATIGETSGSARSVGPGTTEITASAGNVQTTAILVVQVPPGG